jgi:transposase
MFRTYKYLLRPNTEQARQLDFLLWQSRLVYNAALEQRLTTYQETGKGVNYGAQKDMWKAVRKRQWDLTGGLKANHKLRVLDPTTGKRIWMRLDEFAEGLSAEPFEPIL